MGPRAASRAGEEATVLFPELAPAGTEAAIVMSHPVPEQRTTSMRTEPPPAPAVPVVTSVDSSGGDAPVGLPGQEEALGGNP